MNSSEKYNSIYVSLFIQDLIQWKFKFSLFKKKLSFDYNISKNLWIYMYLANSFWGKENLNQSVIFYSTYLLIIHSYSNFLIYEIWNEQYRKSPYYFLQSVVFCKSFCSYSFFGNKPIDANIDLKQGAIHMSQHYF